MRKNVPKISQPQEIIRGQLRGYDSSKLHNRRSGSLTLTLHAATTASHRSDVEVLCRYILRPPLAIDRLTLREDGHVALALPRAWSDGTTTLTFEPLAFSS